jgi:hypothetical protein
MSDGQPRRGAAAIVAGAVLMLLVLPGGFLVLGGVSGSQQATHAAYWTGVAISSALATVWAGWGGYRHFTRAPWTALRVPGMLAIAAGAGGLITHLPQLGAPSDILDLAQLLAIGSLGLLLAGSGHQLAAKGSRAALPLHLLAAAALVAMLALGGSMALAARP